MDVLPSIGWYENNNRFKTSPKLNQKRNSYLGVKWKMLDQNLIHIFTHFKLNCSVAVATINNENKLLNKLDKSTCRFVKEKNINKLALPSLIKKILNSLKEGETFNL